MSHVEAYVEAAPTPVERDARRRYMNELRRRMDDAERADGRRIDAWQDENRNEL